MSIYLPLDKSPYETLCFYGSTNVCLTPSAEAAVKNLYHAHLPEKYGVVVRLSLLFVLSPFLFQSALAMWWEEFLRLE